MKILVFGNSLLENDSLPLRLIPILKDRFPEIEFKEIDPIEDLEKQGRDLMILDSVEGINKVMILNSIEQLHTNKIYSMHDFDLAYNLKLLKKIGKVSSVKIIGVPMGMSEGEAMREISNKLGVM